MRKLSVAILLSLIVSGLALAQDGADSEALSGRLQPSQATELKVDLKGYNGELTLKMVLAPGMSVKKGDVVAELEAPDYADAIERTKENVALAEVSVQTLTDAVSYAEQSYKLQLERTQRNAQRTAEDLDYFLNQQKKDSIRNGELNLESYENNIKDQEEELAQLTELYKGNDLAKESQDIVLNRSKRRLENTKERYEMAKENHQHMVKVDLVRREEDLRSAKEGAALELARITSAGESSNADIKSKLTRAQRGLSDARKALADLEGDKERFKLTAPHDGVVAVGGWNGNDGANVSLKVGDKVGRGSVIATVVDTSKLLVSISVKVESRAKFQPGTTVKVTAKEGEGSASGVVKAIGFVVKKGGMVTALIEVNNSGGTLLAGQNVGVALE
ncbi:MAG: HlyD family efflux transporter periplasmic adaptor subunit [Planctomycetes bacterium]|nr:HlyD family efflux transporter periplasmic adaptor subunit [Planctomycetota bacterium]